MKKLLLLFFAVSLFWTCKNEVKKTAAEVKTEQPKAAQALPPLSQEFVAGKLGAVDYVDIIMYHQSFTMNISQPNSIAGLFAGLTQKSAAIASDCPTQGRVFFNSKGQTMTEADLHFIPGKCAALVFYENGKKAYSSQLNDQGVNIFNNYFNNATKLQSQQ